jgi:hypothetical protein
MWRAIDRNGTLNIHSTNHYRVAIKFERSSNAFPLAFSQDCSRRLEVAANDRRRSLRERNVSFGALSRIDST